MWKALPERLSLYTRLDSCENEAELQSFHVEMLDRFVQCQHQ
jgi:transcription-repair coupling factor (superfamily II helicase)